MAQQDQDLVRLRAQLDQARKQLANLQAAPSMNASVAVSFSAVRVARLAAGLAKARRPQAPAAAAAPESAPATAAPPRPATATATATARPPPPPLVPAAAAAAAAPPPSAPAHPSQAQSAEHARARELLPPSDDGGSAAVAGVPAGWGPARLAAFLERTGVKPLGVDKAAGETRAVARFAGPADRARARQALDDMGPAAASGLSLLLPLSAAAAAASLSPAAAAAAAAAAAGKRYSTSAADAAAEARRGGKAARPSSGADAPTAAAQQQQQQQQQAGPPGDVRAAVCPWHATPYGEQLRLKAATVLDSLRRAAEGVQAIHDRRAAGGFAGEAAAPPPAWLLAAAQRPGGAAAPLPAIVRAPQLEGYRSKSEFSVGLDLQGKPAVGFLHGSFRDGVTAVGDAARCRHTSAAARTYASLLQRFLRGDPASATEGKASALEVWDKTSNSGFWRMLLVREGRAATFLPLPLSAGGGEAAGAAGVATPTTLADVPLERWLVRLPDAQFGGPSAAEGDAEHPAVAAFQDLLRSDGAAASLEQVPALLEPGQEGEAGGCAPPGATNSAEPRAPPSDEVMLSVQVNPLYVRNRVDAGERAALAAAAARELRALAAFFAAAPAADPSLPAATSLLVQYHFGVSNAAPANASLMPLEKAALDFDAVAAGRDEGGGGGGDKADAAAAAAAPPPPVNALAGAPPLASGPGSCAGDPQCLHESLCDLRFRISPAAFFQVNAPATCLLYRLVGDMATAGAAPDAAGAAAAADGAPADGAPAPAPATTAATCQLLLDVCCGTGTIGVSLSDRAARVYGVDSSAPAVEDARRNAAANAKSAAAAGRCEFVCATAESALPALLREEGVAALPPGAVVAVADPPRAGLHKNVLRALLAAPAVRRLVLVSCNPASLAENLVDLCRPSWSRARGEAREGGAFRPVLAVAVDLFPHTRHVEAVVLLER